MASEIFIRCVLFVAVGVNDLLQISLLRGFLVLNKLEENFKALPAEVLRWGFNFVIILNLLFEHYSNR